MSKMKKCKICGADIASSAKTCPQCGAKNSKPIYKKVWFWVVIILVIMIVEINSSMNSMMKHSSAASDAETSASKEDDSKESSTESKDKTVAEKPKKAEKFELVGDVTTESDQFGVYVSGVIKNNSGRDCSYAQVTFNLYDKDGNQLGTALANINNLEKDGKWKFKAVGVNTNGEVASCKLGEITGF